MPTVLIRLGATEIVSDKRSLLCPHCQGALLSRWGRFMRNIQDTHERVTEFYRYRCNDCGATFRVYPAGLNRQIHSQRIRDLAALGWVIGMSCRDMVNVFDKLGVQISRMSVWRDGKQLIERLKEGGKLTETRRYTIDRNFIPKISNKLGVVLVIELEQGKAEILGVLDEYNPRPVKAWLEKIVEEMDIEVCILGTDTLNRKYVPRMLKQERV
jgi:transposase-like protein